MGKSVKSVCPIEPLFDRVILKEDTPDEVTEGGIVVPAMAQEKTKTARVVAVGVDCKRVVVGDHVIHTKYSGTELELDRITYVIVPEEELLGRLA